MKDYMKPELEKIIFSTEDVTSMSTVINPDPPPAID